MQVNSIPNNNYCCANCQPCQTQAATINQQPQANTAQPVQYQQAAYAQQPQMQVNPPQSVQLPSNTSGVNIQIFNPSISAPGAPSPTYNVNAPNYYPPNYYTGTIRANDGNNNNSNCNCNCDCNNANKTNGENGNQQNNGVNSTDNTNGQNNSGANTNATDNNTNSTTTNTNETNKKTENKKIVELTDQYIMNLENYLNSQDKDIRLNAAKEVYARLEEDPSRKDDKALTALINKMLQDPNSEVRMLALGALDGRYVQGDDFTVKLLQDMQSKPDGYGQDAIDAAEILLKMSGKQVEKEVEVDPSRQKKTVKTETKTETKKG